MARKTRSKRAGSRRLASPPEVHAENFEQQHQGASESIVHARAAIQRGDCRTALDSLVDVAQHVGAAANEALVDVAQHVGAAANEALVDVAQHVGAAANEALVDVAQHVGAAANEALAAGMRTEDSPGMGERLGRIRGGLSAVEGRFRAVCLRPSRK